MKYFFLFLFINNFLFSQSKYTKACYSIEPLMSDKLKNMIDNQNYGHFIKESLLTVKKMEPVLVFDDYKSIYFIKNHENSLNFNLTAVLFNGYSSEVIVDIRDDFVKKNNVQSRFFKEDTFLLIDKLEFDWVITDESKMIENYLCYKAYIKSTDTNLSDVVAWFCPELPYSFGPKGYAGLPGLIVELNDSFSILGLKKIEFNIIDDDNVFNLKGTEITSQDYHKIVKEKMLD